MRGLFYIIIFLMGIFSFNNNGFGQMKEVYKWTFTANHIKDNEYELLIKADNLNPEWHFWTMDPGNEMLIPTQVKFNVSDDFRMDGDFTVEGATVSTSDELFGDVIYYEGDVVFKQKIKANAGSSVSGSIIYQACNATTCLAPKEIPFSISLNTK